MRIVAGHCDEFLVTRGLAFQHLADTLCLGVVLGEHRIGFTLGHASDALGFGFRIDLDLLPLDHLLGDDFFFESCEFLFLFGNEDVLGRLGPCDLTTTLGVRLGLGQRRAVVSDLCLGFVLALDRCGFQRSHLDTLGCLGFFFTLHGKGCLLGDRDFLLTCCLSFTRHTFGFELGDVDSLVTLGTLLADLRLCDLFRNGDLTFTVGIGRTNGTFPIRKGRIDLRLVDRLGGGLLTQRLDVARLIRNVTDVHVDHVETNFIQFEVDVLVDQIQEFFAVLVDLFNRQRRDDQTHLAEDDVPCLIGDRPVVQAQQTLGRVVHDVRIGRDADGKGRGHADTDVFL